MLQKADGETEFQRLHAGATPISKQTRRFQLYMLLAVFDMVAILMGFLAAGLLRPEPTFGSNGLRLALLVVPIYAIVALNGSAYGYHVLLNWKRGMAKAAGALIFSMAAVLFVAFFSRASLEFSRLVFTTGAVLAVAFLGLGRYGFNTVVRHTLGSVMRTELIILDNCDLPPLGDAWVIDAAAYGLRPNLRDPNMLDRLGTAVRGADFVLVCCAIEDRAAWSLLLKGTDVQGFVLAPEFDEAGANRIMRYEGQSVMQVASGPLDVRNRAIKRVMDLAVTLPAIIALSPLLLTVAIAIKLDSKGPILFRQQRLGRSNRLFSVFKFRSMHVEDCDADGNRSITRNDRRVTRVGALIRAVSIDELPQLFNVLRGEMSLVGPRPHALGSLAGEQRFWEVDQRYWHRHALKPGITGLAQVRGLRGETRERDDLVKRLQADLEYLNDWSLGRDIAIMLATFKVIVHDKAY